MSPVLKKSKQALMVPFALFFVNIILLNIAFILSFLIRYGPKFSQTDNFTSYKDSVFFLTFIYMSAFAFVHIFKNRFASFWELLRKIFLGLFFGTLLSIAFIYIFRVKWGSFPSTIFIISFIVSLFLFFIVDALILRFTNRIKKKVVIVGEEEVTNILTRNSFVEVKSVDKIEELLQYDDIDEIVISKIIPEHAQLNLLIYLLLKLKVNVVFSPTIYSELISANIMGNNSVRFLSTFIGRRSDAEEFLIRAVDVVGSALSLILLSPLMAVVAVLIKLTSSGPVLYKQVRIAKDGESFNLYKFKTMLNDAEKHTGPVLAVKNDPRVTKIGRFLRATRVDEIPQLFNVIRGQMSLVGPRPERPHFVNSHQALREIRLAVKPGLTGLAQIRNSYDLKPQHKIKYDYLYIQKRFLLLNFYIIAKTFPVVFLKKGQ